MFGIRILFIRLIHIHRFSFFDFKSLFHFEVVPGNGHFFLPGKTVRHFRNHFINARHKFIHRFFGTLVGFCLIWMIVGKQFAVRPRIVIQSGLGLVLVVFVRKWCRLLVGGSEVAFAVPPVARSVDVPERVINRPDGIPERAVVSPRMNGGGR